MGNTLINAFRKYLYTFDDFGNPFYYEHQEKFEVLEHILNNTAVVLNELNIKPNKKTDVYKAMRLFCKIAFPDCANVNYIFQKTAKCYQPDILIPSLKCAIEYKYAVSESELNDTIDQILTDVEGYSNNPSYRIFYAVFYATKPFCSKERFDIVWKEKHFPNNWKGVYIQG